MLIREMLARKGFTTIKTGHVGQCHLPTFGTQWTSPERYSQNVGLILYPINTDFKTI